MDPEDRNRFFKKYSVLNQSSKKVNTANDRKFNSSVSMSRNKSTLKNKSTPEFGHATKHGLKTIRSMQVRQSAPVKLPLLVTVAKSTPKNIVNILKQGMSVPPKIANLGNKARQQGAPPTNVIGNLTVKKNAQTKPDVSGKKQKAGTDGRNPLSKPTSYTGPVKPRTDALSKAKRNTSIPARLKTEVSANMARELFMKKLQEKRVERGKQLESVMKNDTKRPKSGPKQQNAGGQIPRLDAAGKSKEKQNAVKKSNVWKRSGSKTFPSPHPTGEKTRSAASGNLPSIRNVSKLRRK